MHPAVDCILMPVIRREWTALVRQLYSMPAPSMKPAELSLVLSLDSEWMEEERAYLLSVMEYAGLTRVFSRIEFFSCRIPPHKSLYLRGMPKDCKTLLPQYGWKSGPNLQFFRSVDYVIETLPSVRSLLLMETDLIPTVDYWLDRLNSELMESEDCLLAGARYVGGTRLPETIAHHINGNAVLNLSHPLFRDFFSNWEQLLLECMPIVPENPYDVIIEWALAMKDSFIGTPLHDLVEEVGGQYQPRKAYLRTIVNLGGPHESGPGYRISLEETRSKYPDMALVHCRAALPVVSEVEPVDELNEVESKEENQTAKEWDNILLSVIPGQTSIDALARSYVSAIKRNADGFLLFMSRNRALRKIFVMVLNRCLGSARADLIGAMSDEISSIQSVDLMLGVARCDR